MTLEELEVYRIAMDIGERVWSEVVKWDFFAKDTVGKQLTRAVDSIAANLSEGFGRFHFKENKQFGYYSRESLLETKTWLTKAAKRGLISQDYHTSIECELNQLGRMLNSYIKSIGSSSLSVHDDSSTYGDPMTNDQ